MVSIIIVSTVVGTTVGVLSVLCLNRKKNNE